MYHNGGKLYLKNQAYFQAIAIIHESFDEYIHYGITGCGVFKAGVQNWKGFCIKISCSQMKLLNFENWTNGEPQ